MEGSGLWSLPCGHTGFVALWTQTGELWIQEEVFVDRAYIFVGVFFVFVLGPHSIVLIRVYSSLSAEELFLVVLQGP